MMTDGTVVDRAVIDLDTDVARAIAAVCDPEMPYMTLLDLGVLRTVDIDEEARHVAVTMTPTYSGCPAMEVMRRDVRVAAEKCGYGAEVEMVLSPAWTTDWITDAGRQSLLDHGIAPPGPASGPGALRIGAAKIECPNCGSWNTSLLTRFGSTSCRAVRSCRDCGEPFDEFKAI